MIWRAGKIIRRFDDWGAELSWSFEANGNQVASHAGPLHFDNEQAWNLYDIATGLLLKHWQCSDKKPKPDWASPDLECGE